MVRNLIQAFGWTVEDVCKLTLAQIAMITEPDNPVVQMTPAQYRAMRRAKRKS